MRLNMQKKIIKTSIRFEDFWNEYPNERKQNKKSDFPILLFIIIIVILIILISKRKNDSRDLPANSKLAGAGR